MKIIKPGDKAKQIRRFECPTCGCIFEANHKEWIWGDSITMGFVILNYNPKAVCPCCGETVVEILEFPMVKKPYLVK